MEEAGALSTDTGAKVVRIRGQKRLLAVPGVALLALCMIVWLHFWPTSTPSRQVGGWIRDERIAVGTAPQPSGWTAIHDQLAAGPSAPPSLTPSPEPAAITFGRAVRAHDEGHWLNTGTAASTLPTLQASPPPADFVLMTAPSAAPIPSGSPVHPSASRPAATAEPPPPGSYMAAKGPDAAWRPPANSSDPEELRANGNSLNSTQSDGELLLHDAGNSTGPEHSVVDVGRQLPTPHSPDDIAEPPHGRPGYLRAAAAMSARRRAELARLQGHTHPDVGPIAVGADFSVRPTPSSSPSPAPTTVPPSVTPSPSPLPPPQRPLAGDLGAAERNVTGPPLEARVVHSLNPPYWRNPEPGARGTMHKPPAAEDPWIHHGDIDLSAFNFPPIELGSAPQAEASTPAAVALPAPTPLNGTADPSPSVSPSVSATASFTPTSTATASLTPSATPTASATSTASSTATVTATPIPADVVNLAREWPSVAGLLNATVPLHTLPAVSAELDSRLVIAIAMGVHSGGTDVLGRGLVSLPVFNTLLYTFLPTAQPHHIYRFYLAFDHNDKVYESAAWRSEVEAYANRLFAEEEARRPHPTGYVPGATIDNTTLLMSLHWVHCPYSAKPAWAHSDAAIAAVKEGADYVYRTNDDTAFPVTQDWVDRFVMDLRSRRPVPNLGVVGPSCEAGATQILTHDFTHRTHAAIFGYQYPPSLPDWSSDDWITYVYQSFQLMTKRVDVPVVHRMHGQRYHATNGQTRLRVLNAELRTGADTLTAWLHTNHNVTLPYEGLYITCCR